MLVLELGVEVGHIVAVGRNWVAVDNQAAVGDILVVEDLVAEKDNQHRQAAVSTEKLLDNLSLVLQDSALLRPVVATEPEQRLPEVV